MLYEMDHVGELKKLVIRVSSFSIFIQYVNSWMTNTIVGRGINTPG